MNFISKILCVSFALMALHARAVTWDQIRTAALTHSRDLQSANLSITKSEEDIRSSRSGYFPSAQATGTLSRSKDAAPAVWSTPTRVGVTASQNLFAGFSDHANVVRAEATRESSLAAKAVASAAQRAVLRKLFHRMIYLQESLELAKKRVERRTANVGIVGLRYEGGRENKSALLKTEAAKMESVADQDLIGSSMELARLELTQISGMTLNPNDVFEGTLDVQLPATHAFSASQHPKLMQAKAEREAASANVDRTRSGWLPKLSADASAFRNGNGSNFDPESRYAVSLSLSVPLFSPAQDPNYRMATLDLMKSDVSLVMTQEDLELTEKRAFLQVQTANSKVLVARKTLEANIMQAEVYRQRYTLGLISFQDWDGAERDFISAESNLLSARQNLADALTSLQEANGMTLEEQHP